ncbi:oxaloacetate decarboxylase [Streptosporangium amethystogenes]|uniref:oxaloacetate decarboxylase n=1 Tax=Streptosporangium amethystogenes TaxID=2002 RepID=UPI0037B3DA81
MGVVQRGQPHNKLSEWDPAGGRHPARMTAELRRQLKAGTVVAAGCFDPLSARLAEYVGFSALHVTGSGVESTQLGAPDLGLITMTELAAHTARIAAAVNIPMICDIDTGFGGVDNVMRTVREMIRSGVAGIHIEDQETPKVSPMLPTRRILSREAAVGRVQAALAARADSDFVVVARSDADAVSFDELVTRCNLYLEAGADLVFPMFMSYQGKSIMELGREERIAAHAHLVREIDGPIMAMSHPVDANSPTVQEIADTGISIVITPTTSLQAATNAMYRVLKQLHDQGDVSEYFRDNPEEISTFDVYRMLGLDGYLANKEKYERIGG